LGENTKGEDILLEDLNPSGGQSTRSWLRSSSMSGEQNRGKEKKKNPIEESKEGKIIMTSFWNGEGIGDQLSRRKKNGTERLVLEGMRRSARPLLKKGHKPSKKYLGPGPRRIL